MKIANIVSTSKVNVSDDFNVVRTMDEIIHGLPTLIVGYDYVDKYYPNFDITSNKLGENLYWTFKRVEKRDKFQEDLEWFKTFVYSVLTKKINYVFLDPIQQKTKTLWKIVRKIFNIKNKISYVNGDMVYIYGENLIFGVDLKLLKFMLMDINKIKEKIKNISDVFLDDNKILIEYKKNVGELGEQARYIPFLYSISNEQNNTSSLIHISRESGMVS